jgi:hypothetical protein
VRVAIRVPPASTTAIAAASPTKIPAAAARPAMTPSAAMIGGAQQATQAAAANLPLPRA